MDCCQDAEDYTNCLRKLLIPCEIWYPVEEVDVPEEGEVLVYMRDGEPVIWRYVKE